MSDGASAVLERIRALGILPVVVLDELSHAEPLLDALGAGGLPAAEITLRTPAGLAALERLRRTRPDALLGAGTVRTRDDARRALDAGAQLVVSPAMDLDVLETCRDAGVLVLPGVCTPTEVDVAARAGARVVKLFPAEAIGGTRLLAALAGPFPEMAFVPTGGIDESSLGRYLALPNVLACGGSFMVEPSLLREGRFDEVEERARRALAVVARARAGAGPATRP